MDYFEILGLDPDARWDQKKFEQLLQQKQIDWSNLSNGVGPRAVQAHQYLHALPDMRATMSDPKRRREHATTVREKKATKRKEELQRQIDWYNAQKTMTSTELDKFVEAYAGFETRERIMAELHVDIRPTSADKSKVSSCIDASTLNTIDSKLSLLTSANLYDLLGCSHADEEHILQAAAKNLYEEAVQSQATVQKDLAVLAQSIFSSPEKRKHYDIHLRQNFLDTLCKELDVLMERKSEKVLPEALKEDFLKKASTAGCSEEEAYNRLVKYVIQQGWRIQHESGDKGGQKRQDSERLRNLIGRKYYYAAKHLLTNVELGVLEEQERQFYQGEIEKAVKRARQEWNQAKSQSIFSSREERIAHCRAALQICADYQDVRQLLSELLVAPRNFQAYIDGTVVVLTWELPAPGMQCRIIRNYGTRPLLEADGQHLVTSAEGGYEDHNVEIGVPVYYVAFTVCDTVSSMMGTPHEPLVVMAEVTDVRVQAQHSRIELAWSIPPNLHNLIVRRKEGIAPRSIHEGRAIASQDMRYVIDEDVQCDIAYFYSVYCQFKTPDNHIETTSGVTVSAALTTQSNITTGAIEEVSDLSYRQLGILLRLQWHWPSGCQKVNITCTERYDRGTVTRRVTREEYNYFGYHDIECMMGQEYVILVATVYEQGERQIISSGIDMIIFVEEWITVEYEIKKKFYNRRRYLILRSSGPVQLPPFRLVYQRHRLPLTKDEGELVFSSSETIVLDGERHLPIGERSYPPDTFGKVFFEDEDTAGRVRFRLLNREKSRLG